VRQYLAQQGGRALGIVEATGTACISDRDDDRAGHGVQLTGEDRVEFVAVRRGVGRAAIDWDIGWVRCRREDGATDLVIMPEVSGVPGTNEVSRAGDELGRTAREVWAFSRRRAGGQR